MLFRIVAIAAAGALACSFSLAGASAASRERPRPARAARPAPAAPPAEIARLAALTGVWNFEGTARMGKSRARKVRWRLACKASAGGWALVCDETLRLPRLPASRGHDLFGYDATTGTLHFFTVNSMGEVRDLPGKWVDDRTMHFRYEGTQGGKPFVEDATLAIRDDVTFDMDVTVSIGGEPRVVFDGTFHKAPPRPRRPRNRAPAAPAEPQAPAPQQ